MKCTFKTTGFLLLILFASVSALAQEVLVRKDSFSTEVFLRIAPGQIRDVAQDGFAVTVTFQHPMKSPFSQILDDPFIESIIGSGNMLTVTFKDTSDFAAVLGEDGLRLLATRPRELDNVLLSYGMGAPMLRKDNIFTDDPVYEAQLRRFDALMSGNDYYTAVNEMSNMFATTRNPFYRQEALFRMGQAYMAIAATNPAVYLDAANVFDQFVHDFPESNRLMQAKLLAAEAKEKGGALIEAVIALRDIYQSSADAETRRQMLLRMADIYISIGQYDNAIEIYEEYLENFLTDQERVKALLGSLYIQRQRQDDSYRLFSQVPVNVLTQTLTPAEILSLADVFRQRGEVDKAYDMYRYLAGQEIYESAQAWAKIAEIEKERGNTANYSIALQRVMDLAGNSLLGLRAMVEYAELHYAEQSAEEWRSFLDPIFVLEDQQNLRPRAEMVLINALLAAGDVFTLVASIDRYIETYPEEETNARLLEIKENVLFEQAVEYHTEKNYDQALAIYRQLLAQFPESERVPQVVQYIDDIYYDRAAIKYNEGDFRGALDAVESWMLENDRQLAARWPLLWEDAMYQYIMKNVGVLDPRTIRFKAREYLTNVPNGRYEDEIKQVLLQNFQYPFNEAFNSGNDAYVVALFEENRPWLETWRDQTVNNRAKITVTRSLVRMGLRDQAEDMFQSITPMMTADYAELGYTLCQPNLIYNINNLTTEQFLSIVDEAERCGDPDYTFSLINRYTVDMRTALQAKYRVIKNITDDRRREAALNELYQQITSNSAYAFEGYEEIFLDMGLLAYRRNDFAGAVLPLQRFIDSAPADSEKRAEAMYYLGKSLVAINERDRGLGYFRQIVDTMPDSVYKNMARSELEDEAWRNNMSRS